MAARHEMIDQRNKMEQNKMPPPPKPKLVNRGPSGLLTKLPTPAVKPADAAAVSNGDDKPTFLQKLLAKYPDAAQPKISPALLSMVVETSSLTPDPMNARKHPERNMEAIMQSLAAFGQVKPVVVRKEGMVVMAGNGTTEAFKRLGWTKIAAAVTSMTDVEAAAYGLADNRTAELATWDFATVSILEKLISDGEGDVIGFSEDELTALRLHDWTPPPTDFPEMDEHIAVEHVCPRCNYHFSGGEVVAAALNGKASTSQQTEFSDAETEKHQDNPEEL